MCDLTVPGKFEWVDSLCSFSPLGLKVYQMQGAFHFIPYSVWSGNKFIESFPNLIGQISTLQDFLLFFQKPTDCACQGTWVSLVPLSGKRHQKDVRVKFYYSNLIEQQESCQQTLTVDWKRNVKKFLRNPIHTNLKVLLVASYVVLQ